MTKDVVSDVVTDEQPFSVPPKVQAKMQSRFNIMQNIQNMTKIVNDTQNMINQAATIISRLEDSDEPYSRIYRDIIIPVKDNKSVVKEMNDHVDAMARDLDKHISQIKSMQIQHDGLTEEINILMEDVKLKQKPVEVGIEEVKAKLKDKRRRQR